ncbi:GNAT family N-acetyltransferase [Flavobacterium sp. MK4S-17]|uniref:GNAT family N-acetyltransferase n=1 Tax=Flavobacterium sp. MK4S-17 TaxID=2543737 RepID=UPI00135A9BD8|nr:GNAT family N-acetyltransferase [Flavobacterium sp. MK4S-17]
MEISNQVIEIKTGFENMDINAVHQFLSKESYWAKGIPMETVSVALKNSFCIGLFKDKKQIGFARLVTDYTIFGYMAGVYILKEYRGEGLSKMMMKYIMELDFVQGLRRTLLATFDAHSLYHQFGFKSPENPERLMEIKRNNLYKYA